MVVNLDVVAVSVAFAVVGDVVESVLVDIRLAGGV